MRWQQRARAASPRAMPLVRYHVTGNVEFDVEAALSKAERASVPLQSRWPAFVCGNVYCARLAPPTPTRCAARIAAARRGSPGTRRLALSRFVPVKQCLCLLAPEGRRWEEAAEYGIVPTIRKPADASCGCSGVSAGRNECVCIFGDPLLVCRPQTPKSSLS